MSVFNGVGYCRVSTDKQVYGPNGERIEDNSLDTQKRRVEEYLNIKSQNGDSYVLLNFLEDAGISGKDTKSRPAYQKMWKLIEDKKIDFIIATELSRLSRSTADFLKLMEHCKYHDVHIFLLREGFDPSTTYGKMLATMTAMFSELERETTCERVRVNALSRLRTRGRINGSCPILGLDKSETTKELYEINKVEVNRLNVILDIFINSEGKSDCLRILKEKKLFDKDNVPFTRSRFENLLFNLEWRYNGLWYEKDKKGKIINKISLPHGPLLGDEIRQKALEKMRSCSQNRKRCGNKGHTYLLSGLLFSASGYPYSGSKGNGSGGVYYYYYDKKSKRRINASLLEDRVIGYVLNTISNSHYLGKLIDKSYLAMAEEVDLIYKKIEEINKELAMSSSTIRDKKLLLIHENLTSESINLISQVTSELETKNEKLNKEKSELEKQLHDKQSGRRSNVLVEKIERIKSNLLKASRKQKKLLLREFFEKIIVLDLYEIKFIIKQASTSEAFLYDVLIYREKKKFHNIDLVKGLYLKKHLSINQISIRLGCSRSVIRRILEADNIALHDQRVSYPKISKKIDILKKAGNSYAEIANKLNLWRVPTRSEEGKWYAKTVRDLVIMSN